MNLIEFIKDIELLLSNASVLHKSGSVLYSAAHTLTKGDAYILGLNPGGIEGLSISEDLAALPNKSLNSYLDEYWGKKGIYRVEEEPKGQAPLQIRLNKLVNAIGLNLSNVCASNLVFMRSRNDKGINYPHDANICWATHEKILNIVKPNLIIAFGNSSRSPYRYLSNKFNLGGHESEIESGHGNWKCRSFEALILGRTIRVVGFPHLSRYSPLDKNGAVREDIKNWLRQGLVIDDRGSLRKQ